ncbi:MAG: two component signal transduction system LytT family response regulator [Idiomarinaceae bacterium HL-53]|nr:MAG: two component signal transduction system LytT family response regulator [Idiomarinaceae bacterium HL-53]CUS49030.1 two component transcriptional regulator, LytTR family [Idiomarinaceae bacterium HL-53]
MKNNIKVLIVDDEPLARRGLQVRLSGYEFIDVVGEASTGKEAVTLAQALQPDLIFLDIQMPGWNGFDVLKQLKAQGSKIPQVVFVTAYDQYAIKAFEVRALDYLLKPVDEDRLKATLERIKVALGAQDQNRQLADEQQQKLLELVAELIGEDCEEILQRLAEGQAILNDSYPEHIAIKDSGEITRVAVNSIAWIDAAGDYMCIHAGSETHILRRTMKELEQELNPKLFQRIHRSAIVNIDQVEKLCSRQNGEYHVVLSNGKELKVSRSYKDRIKQLILGR